MTFFSSTSEDVLSVLGNSGDDDNFSLDAGGGGGGSLTGTVNDDGDVSLAVVLLSSIGKAIELEQKHMEHSGRVQDSFSMRDFSRHVLLCLHLKKATHLFCLPTSSQRIPDYFLFSPSSSSSSPSPLSLVSLSLSRSVAVRAQCVCVEQTKDRAEENNKERRKSPSNSYAHTCIVWWTVYTLLFFSFKYMSSVFIDRTYSPHSLVAVVFFFSLLSLHCLYHQNLIEHKEKQRHRRDNNRSFSPSLSLSSS